MEKTKTLADTIRELGEARDYNGQAEALLKASGVLYEAQKAVPQLAPAWAKDGKHGIQWSITLGKLKDKPSATVSYFGTVSDNLRHCSVVVQFFFWGSIAHKEKAEYGTGKKPRAYDVLAGIYSQVDTFEDFCANFGYSEDSREAERTYNEVRELNAKIESIFTPEELAALAEIQ